MITNWPAANGGFDNGFAGSSRFRPAQFTEASVGGLKLWIPVMLGTGTFTTTISGTGLWSICNRPFAGPALTYGGMSAAENSRHDFRNRWFRASMLFDQVSTNNASSAETIGWAQDSSISSANKIFPTTMAHGASANWDGTAALTSPLAYDQSRGVKWAMGNTVYPNGDFNTLVGSVATIGGNPCTVAAIFRSVYYYEAAGSGNVDCSLAILCDNAGNLWLAGSQTANHYLNNRSALIVLEASPQLPTFGLY